MFDCVNWVKHFSCYHYSSVAVFNWVLLHSSKTPQLLPRSYGCVILWLTVGPSVIDISLTSLREQNIKPSLTVCFHGSHVINLHHLDLLLEWNKALRFKKSNKPYCRVWYLPCSCCISHLSGAVLSHFYSPGKSVLGTDPHTLTNLPSCCQEAFVLVKIFCKYKCTKRRNVLLRKQKHSWLAAD